MLPLSALGPKPSISSPTQNQAPVTKTSFQSQNSCLDPPPSQPSPVQPQPSPLNRQFQTQPSQILQKIRFQSQPPAPAQPPAPTPTPKIRFQPENLVKTFGQNFRSKLIGTQTLNNFYKPQTPNPKSCTLNLAQSRPRIHLTRLPEQKKRPELAKASKDLLIGGIRVSRFYV